MNVALHDASVAFLPIDGEIETRLVLKQLTRAHQALAELKGVAASMPNQNILVNTLSLQEAKDSSAIENIITTHDDLYQSDHDQQQFVTLAAKEVHSYARALRAGFERVKTTGLITQGDILTIQEQIDGSRAGLRKLPGTNLKNEQTAEVIYTPPQHPDDIQKLMDNLIDFMNTPEACDWDPLTKMAIIHHQFESIHPFYDGNGRVGRVLNVLFLVQNKLLDIPILYLSRFINQHKQTYYQELQNIRNAETRNWEAWILFILEGVEQTARYTCTLIHDINKQMMHIKHTVRSALPKIYSQDLVNTLFTHPYTKVEFLVSDLRIHRNTAVKYLNALVDIKILEKMKLGKENYYLNHQLFDLLHDAGSQNTDASS